MALKSEIIKNNFDYLKIKIKNYERQLKRYKQVEK